MNILADKFRKNGFEFEQVKRVENWAIYRKRKAEWSEGLYSYEIVKIRVRKEKKAFGVTFEAGEYYPSSEEWGVFAWTECHLIDAERRLAGLIPSRLKNRGTP